MTSESQNSPRSVLIKAALWAFATRWSVRAIGLLNTVIMARILAPEDYGVVALATVISGAIQTLLDFGASQALLRKDKVTEDEIHTVWTLRLIQCVVAALILLGASGLAADYFNNPRLMYLLWALAGGCVVSGFASIGSTLALKAYNFSIDFKINVAGKIVGVVATIFFGFMLRDYRALIIGILASQMTGFILSYALYPYRPKFCLTHVAEVWKVTKWLVVSNMGAYILNKGDQLIAARVSNAHDYGLYNVGGDLGAMPIQEAGPALLRAILPVLGNYSEDLNRAKQIALKAFATISGILWGICGWVFLISIPLTELILGEKWRGAEVYVALVAIMSTMQVTFSPFGSLLLVHGEARKLGTLVWFEFLVFAVMAFILLQHSGLTGLVYARMISIFVKNQIFVQLLRKSAGVQYLREVATPELRHVAAAVIAVLIPKLLLQLDGVAVLFQLAIYSATYLLVYCTSSLLTWRLLGQPAGVETVFLELVSPYLKKKDK